MEAVTNFIFSGCKITVGFPGGSVVRNPPARAGDTGDAVWSQNWEDPLEEEMKPTPVFLLGNPMDRGVWWALFMESQRVGHDWAHTHTHTHTKSLRMVTAATKLKDPCSLEGNYDKPRQHIKKQRHHFANKGPYSQSYVFSSSHVCMWDLDHKEGQAPKNWCFWTMVLKTLESPSRLQRHQTSQS